MSKLRLFKRRLKSNRRKNWMSIKKRKKGNQNRRIIIVKLC